MKIFIKLLFIFIIMFLFLNNVKAADAKCVYDLYTVVGTPGTGPVKEKVTIEFKDSKLSFSWYIAAGTRRTATFTNNSKDIEAMRTLNGVLNCPPQIYFGVEDSLAGAKYHFSFSEDSLKEFGNSISNPIDLSASVVNNDPIPDPDEEDPSNPSESEEVTCKYNGSQTIVFNKDSKNVSVFLNSTTYGDCPNSNYNHLISGIEKLNYTCPSNLCVSKGSGGPYGTLCTVSLTNQGAPGTTCYAYSEGTSDPGSNIPEIPNDPIEGAEGTIKCDAFKKLTDPLWKWMRIIAPILAVTLGTMDLLKAVASDDEKAIKKSVGDFGKRLGLTALLFLLPYVVGILVGLAGYGDSMACL